MYTVRTIWSLGSWKAQSPQQKSPSDGGSGREFLKKDSGRGNGTTAEPPSATLRKCCRCKSQYDNSPTKTNYFFLFLLKNNPIIAANKYIAHDLLPIKNAANAEIKRIVIKIFPISISLLGQKQMFYLKEQSLL